MGLREQILEHQDPRMALEKLDVPEWGCSVYVRRWTGTERDAFEREFGEVAKNHPPNLRARILVRFLLDESGGRIFTDADADALGEKAADVVSRLFTEVTQRSGMLASDAEDARKN